MVVTESFARRYFGDADPVGGTLTFDTKNDYRVTGLMRDVPAGSHFTFDFLVSLETYANPMRESWVWNQFYTYFLLKEGASPDAVAARFPALLGRNMAAEEASAYDVRLQKLTDIHLRSHLFREIEPNSTMANVTIFSAVALLILAIAGINFMNLTTARALARAKEVGVRKAVGASRLQLTRQFLAESLLMSAAAFALSLGLAALLLPVFRPLAGPSLVLFGASQAGFLAAMAGLALAVGLAAGLYPAFVLSAFRPSDALRGQARGLRGGLFRKGLVVFQFAASAFLLVATGIVRDQLHYVQGKRLGFDMDHLIVVPIRDDGMRSGYETAKRELLGVPGVLGASASGNLPGGSDWGIPYEAEGLASDSLPPMRQLLVDQDFMATYKLELASGRSFSVDHPTDATSAVMINEEAARQLGWADPLGKTMAVPALKRGASPIIGVIRDFHFRSLHEKIGPIMVLVATPEMMTVLSPPHPGRRRRRDPGRAGAQVARARPGPPLQLLVPRRAVRPSLRAGAPHRHAPALGRGPRGLRGLPRPFRPGRLRRREEDQGDRHPQGRRRLRPRHRRHAVEGFHAARRHRLSRRAARGRLADGPLARGLRLPDGDRDRAFRRGRAGRAGGRLALGRLPVGPGGPGQSHGRPPVRIGRRRYFLGKIVTPDGSICLSSLTTPFSTVNSNVTSEKSLSRNLSPL